MQRSLRTTMVVFLVFSTGIGCHASEPAAEEVRPNADALPEGVIHAIGRGRFRAAGQIAEIQLSPGGGLLVSLSAAGEARIWDVVSGRLVNRFRAPRDARPIAFSPDGGQLAVVNSEGEILWLDGRKGTVVSHPPLDDNVQRPLSVSYFPDGELLAIGCGDNHVRIVKAGTGALVAEWKCEFSPRQVVVRDEGKTVLALDHGGRSTRWDYPSGNLVGSGRNPFVGFGSFNPSGFNRNGVAFNAGGNIINWYPGNKYNQVVIIPPVRITGAALSDDGRTILGGEQTGRFRLWNAEDKSQIAGIDDAFGEAAEHVASSRDASVVAAAPSQRGNRIRVWKVDRTKTPASFAEFHPDDGHQAGINSLQFSRDGRLLFSTSIDETARLFDSHGGDELTRFSRASWGTMSAGRERVVVDGINLPDARLLDLDESAKAVLKKKFEEKNRPALSPDGRRVSLHSMNPRRLEVWDVASERVLWERPGDDISSYSAAFTPDSRLLVVSLASGFRAYAVETGDVKCETAKSEVYNIAFTADSRFLVVAGVRDDITSKQRVQFWDLESGKLDHEIGPVPRVMGLAVMPDNRRVLTGHLDGTIGCWDLADGRLIKTIQGHHAGVYALAGSQDGKRFASGSMDSQIFIWDAACLNE